MHDKEYNLGVEKLLCTKATLSRTPLSVSFELTPLCNMDCSMCYIRLDRKEQEKIHPLRTVDEWINIAEQLKHLGTLFILLTGGEPLLYPGFMELYHRLKSMGFILTINTNGTLWTEETADLISKDMPRRVNITLYGASNQTYHEITGNPQGFDQTMRTIQLLKERSVPMKLNCSMVPENEKDTKYILDLSEKLEIPLEYNTYMYPCSRAGRKTFNEKSRLSPERAATWDVYIKRRQTKDNFIKMKDNVLLNYYNAEAMELDSREMQCRAGKSSCWINWKGEMTPCVFLEKPSIDVIEYSVKFAWKEMISGCGNLLMPEMCSTCRHRTNCQRCMASTYWEKYGEMDCTYYLCKYMDKVVDLLEKE